ncbi:hypothetical protein Gotri_024510 [Gossypium trilobum]|uniref:Uncharacterized protein n=1 Tax=Gossypium trilobum TaxID=34281 RepID=A0A7J9DMG9_9ROSI|nr:hypothetical protein [Gossypium trilobum]
MPKEEQRRTTERDHTKCLSKCSQFSYSQRIMKQ